MKELLNENTFFATVAMISQTNESLALVVEGDDDRLALKDHCSTDVMLVAGIGGREHILRVARLVVDRKIRGVRFLVDRDYDALVVSGSRLSDVVFVSDRHDLFMDLIANDAKTLARVVEVHAAPAWRNLKKMPRTDLQASSLIERARTIAREFGKVRIANIRCNTNIDFTRIHIGGLVEEQLNAESIIELCLTRSRLDPSFFKPMSEVCGRLQPDSDSPLETLVGDHDFFDALAYVLRSLGAKADAANLQRSFISAISCKSLRPARWFHEVQQWCTANERVGFKCQATVCDAA